jgi:hypothetical protein
MAEVQGGRSALVDAVFRPIRSMSGEEKVMY